MAAVESQALTRAYRPANSNLSKSTRLNVPQFLQKLYEMVNDPANNELIRWSDTGDSFLVLDHERFAREVLGRWFKHQNFQSFVRQLNMYGFHKIPSLQQGVLRSDSDTETWNFEHPHFRQGQPDLLCLISRKKQASQQPTAAIEDSSADIHQPPTSSPGATSSQILDLNQLVTGIQVIKRHQQTISSDLNDLKSSNQALWQEVIAARERHNKQQDMLNRILKFLASVFGHTGGTDAQDRSDGVIPSPPLVARRNGRLLIEDARDPKKSVELVEVDDDAHPLSPTNSSRSEDNGPDFAHIETPSVGSPIMEHVRPTPTPTSAQSPFFVGPNSTPSSAPWLPMNGIPQFPANPFVLPSSDSNQLELHRPQPVQPSSFYSPPGQGPSTSPNQQDAALQAAFQQLMSSPSQIQRFMDALTSSSVTPEGQPNGTAVQPYNTASFFNPSTDFSQLGPELSAQLIPNTDPAKSTLEAVGDDQERLSKVYKSASEVNADIDLVHDNIHKLIENIGLDPSLITPGEHDPSGPGVGNDLLSPPASDFDFDAFLNNLAPGPISGAGFNADGPDPVVGQPSPAELEQSGITAFMDDVTADPEPRAKAQAQAAAAVTGRKRRSDVAGLDLPSPSPMSMLPDDKAHAPGPIAPSKSKRTKT